MCRAADLPLPENFLAQHPFDNGEMTERDERTLPWPRTREAVAGQLARHCASISWTDALAHLSLLQKDPLEMHDRGSRPGQAGRVRELLARAQRENGEHAALTVAHPAIPEWRPPQGGPEGRRRRRTSRRGRPPRPGGPGTE